MLCPCGKEYHVLIDLEIPVEVSGGEVQDFILMAYLIRVRVH